MSELDLTLRGILAFEAGVALLLAGAFFGTIWPERSWPIRTILAGLLGVLAYVLAGQVKAFNLAIPVDGFTLLGLAAYTVLVVGLFWFMRHERLRSRRGR